MLVAVALPSKRLLQKGPGRDVAAKRESLLGLPGTKSVFTRLCIYPASLSSDLAVTYVPW